MGRTRVKICGLTNPADAAMAVQMGADALGFNFFEGSARYISLDAAIEMVSSMPAFVSRVGLFVNPSEADVERVLNAVRFDLLQFHGDESPGFCESFGYPYIKAIKGESSEHILEMAARHTKARALLIDAFGPSGFGGTGETFDWNLIPNMDKQLILAGGLSPDNVADAIRQVQPFAVDVSTGVEVLTDKRSKDTSRMQAFFDAVQAA